MPIWFKAALAQLVAAALTWALAYACAFYQHQLPLDLAPWLLGGLAAMLSIALRLPRWWWPIQFLFVPALVHALTLDAPPIAFLLALLVLILVFPGALRERVPLYLSNPVTWDSVAAFCPDQPFSLIDLGCGTADGLSRLAKRFPHGIFIGVETAPLTYMWARLRLLGQRNARVFFKSFWNERLSSYDVVYAFLSPEPMPALWEKAYAEMKAGSVFISNSFDVPGISPSETVTVDDRRRTQLLVWRF